MPKPRGKSEKKLNPVFRIYCEGAETEPNYINGYLSQHCPSVRLIRVEPTSKNTPVALVDEAVKKKQSKDTPKHDVFWVVYDRESVIKYADSQHQRAYEKARAHGINLAITNVCFEVWFLLHFEDVSAEYASCEDLIKNSPLKKHLATLRMQDYHKADSKLYSLISGNIKDARDRAGRMNEQTVSTAPHGVDRPYLLNPYTDMHKLLDAIDEFYNSTK